ncbi:MAG TPA: sensor histidine kinase, partial [Acidobacteriota bacterium]|nr:sensor histidine kinase [Acidobacteriota bacterium]
GFVRIRFLDQGVGMDPAEYQKVFEPFYRGIRSSGAQGSGLGLFLARRVVELHGGKITAGPNSPRGTQILVELPLIVPAIPAPND